jgi:hypothetical protein
VLEYTEIHGCRPTTSLVFLYYSGRSPIRCVCKQYVAQRVAAAKRHTILIVKY